nr:MAG TPA: hypothetical protein [Caudoviricetes sp.]
MIFVSYKLGTAKVQLFFKTPKKHYQCGSHRTLTEH